MRTITIDKSTQDNLTKASKLTGIDEGELAKRAILSYLKYINDENNLSEELWAWDEMSNEALLNMERNLEHQA
jgi:hypothetical protein